MGNRLLFLAFLVATGHAAVGQADRYMIFYKDKTGTPYSLSAPSAFLSARSIQRRIINNVSLTDQDLPVNPALVDSVKATGATVLYRTRWMNGVLCEVTQAQLAILQGKSFVDHVELAAPGLHPEGRGQGKSRSAKTVAGQDPLLMPVGIDATAAQLGMLGMTTMHDEGIFGQGIMIAQFDDGFFGVDDALPFQDLRTEGRISDASFDFVSGGTDVYRHDSHGTEVLSVMGARIDGDEFTGGAYKATFQLYVTEDVFTEYRVEEYNWLFAAERADSAGADIIQSSLGYNTFDLPSMDYAQSNLDGKTSVITRAAEMATARGIVVVVSAGNEGNNNWKLITVPADGPDVLAVGSVNAQKSRSNFSSTGPTADGRIKPDVCAMGQGTSVISSGGNITTATGTSLAAPLVTSLAAGLMERFPGITRAELVDAIRKTASNARKPNTTIGYGIPDYRAVVHYMERAQQEKPVVVYPNPVTDTLAVVPRSPDEIQELHFQLLNANGQLTAYATPQFTWLNDRFVADVSRLAAGVYILRISYNGEVEAFRVVKY